LNVCPKERAHATLKRGRRRPSREGAGDPQERAQGMPGARCTRSPCAKVESTRRHHRFTGTPGISLRNGFNGFLRALPGDRACLPPSPPRSLLPRNLTPASGRQDHTASPSASNVIRLLTSPASTASRPASVTIASRPSGGTRRKGYAGDLGEKRSGIFLRRGVDMRLTKQPIGANLEAIAEYRFRSTHPDAMPR
jgi:hypothetical protein